ncbi:MAG: hypothetical protein WCR01_11040 [Bacteroidota bacterium]
MDEQDKNPPSPEMLSHPPQWTEEQQKEIDQSLQEAAEKIRGSDKEARLRRLANDRIKPMIDTSRPRSFDLGHA